MRASIPAGASMLLCLAVLPVRAEQDRPAPGATATYALLVGSQRAGQGQAELRFAHQDARRVQAVLTEIGGYPEQGVRLLLDPDAAALRAALAELEDRLAEHARRDERAVLLFYYSGHARASGLNLGPDNVPLTELKQRLEALPATVRVVILDACQSGAISEVKGVEPQRSFSYNSVAGLNTTGMAVMASSSGSELSQESEAVGGSYFTHHLVSGLRGAADSDGDGRVTLSEAYHYAYNRTLVATAATAVGRQHVTLETDLRGKGEMVLTFPAAATARLELPQALAAEVLVHREPNEVVVAEVFKTEGDVVRVALPPGEYGALVRRDERFDGCALTLEAGRTTTLDLGDCEEVEPPAVLAKHAATVWVPTLSLELGFGGFIAFNDEYNQTLDNFGFNADFWGGNNLHFQGTLLYHLDHHFAIALTYSTLDRGEYQREGLNTEAKKTTVDFDWLAHRLGVELRAGLPLLDGWLTPYLQAGGGVTVVRSLLTGELGDEHERYDFGYHISVAAGLQFMPWKHLGMYGQAEYVFAPALDNRTGQQHDSGGFGIALGIRGAY